MKNKLTDDQLDAVSGGDRVDESADNAKLLDQLICPLCGSGLRTNYDGFSYVICARCDVYWTKYYGRWQRYVSKSSGC